MKANVSGLNNSTDFTINTIPLTISILNFTVSFWLLVQILRHAILHTAVNAFMASLCTCNCITAALGLIYAWPYDLIVHHTACLLVNCAFCSSFIVVFLHFMAISVERYLQIVHPFVHLRLTMSRRPTSLALTVLWVASFLIGYSPFLVHLKPTWGVRCLIAPFVIPFWLFFLIYTGVLMLATTTSGIFYFKLYVVITRHMKAIQRQTRTSDAAGHTSNTLLKNSNDSILSQTNSLKSRGSKIKSALSFVILYLYYFMCWAPNTAVKTYEAYTDQLVSLKALDDAVNIIVLLSPVGHCLLFMHLEKDVRRVTLDKLCCRRRWRRIGLLCSQTTQVL